MNSKCEYHWRARYLICAAVIGKRSLWMPRHVFPLPSSALFTILRLPIRAHTPLVALQMYRVCKSPIFLHSSPSTFRLLLIQPLYLPSPLTWFPKVVFRVSCFLLCSIELAI